MKPVLVFGPGVPGRKALGAETLADFLGHKGALEEESRAELLRESSRCAELRYPLPGTPGEDGRLTGAPRGAGTGWVRLVRYRGGGFIESLRARFTEPRSSSLAERDWNLLCALRASGVGTPEPLAVGSLGGGFSRRSFLVTRELQRVRRLEDWFREEQSPSARRLGLAALGAFAGRLLRSGVDLPQLKRESGRELWIGVPREACEGEEAPVAKQRMRRLPPVFVTSVRSGRLEEPLDPPRAAKRLRSWWLALPEDARPSATESFSILRRALANQADSRAIRALWAGLRQDKG